MATPATASQCTSTTRLQRVKELWIADKANREEIGRLLYEERSERLSVGGAGNRTGFHQWLRDAGIPKQSAYRRIAEYEISIGVRAPEDDYDKPVPNGTSLPATMQAQAPVPVEPKPHWHDPNKPHYTFKSEEFRTDLGNNGVPESWRGKDSAKIATNRVCGMGISRARSLAKDLGIDCVIGVEPTTNCYHLKINGLSEKGVREILKYIAAQKVGESVQV